MALAALGLLWLLHNDFWLWDAPHRVPLLAGLPAGFVYHVGYCLAAAALMALLARFAWPGGLEAAERAGLSTYPAGFGSGSEPSAESGPGGRGDGA